MRPQRLVAEHTRRMEGCIVSRGCRGEAESQRQLVRRAALLEISCCALALQGDGVRALYERLDDQRHGLGMCVFYLDEWDLIPTRYAAPLRLFSQDLQRMIMDR